MPLPPPAPRAPAARAKTQRPPEKSTQALLSGSWPAATSRRSPAPASPRPPARAALPPPVRCAPPSRARSYDSLPPGAARAGPGPGGTRFALRLPPDSALLVQRRHLERQLARAPRSASPASARAARRPPPLSPGNPSSPPRVSLLNEQHKYEDVEDEDGAPAAHERLVRKCTEWLRGVETATTRDRAARVGSLPHMGTL
ncbi:PREDICTED: proline-rich protein 18 [Elephantulus edwardii]|uniref:proline-rich protein 18 n=1 Tax=Elephantulus edwardii TaxID=28737 RepID=UPI0003F0B5DD|nr:PREDICTED: proline-rich protein 18 [Elephantulus edwardii]